MIDEKLLSFGELPEGSLAAVAAKKHGCKLDDLLKWREYDDGTVVIILATGQKYKYSAVEMLEAVLEDMGLGCAGTGAVIRTEADMVTPIASDSHAPEPGTGENALPDVTVRRSLISEAEIRGDVTKEEVPVAGDGLAQSVSLATETPDPGDGVLAQSASQVTKSEEKMVTDAAAAVAKDVAKSPAKRRSTRSRTKKAPSAGTGDPDK